MGPVLDGDSLAVWARRLLDDYDSLRPWRTFVPPVGMTAEQAYVLQGEVARLREARGERMIGYKVGCTSRAVQDQLGIREPIFARVFDSGRFPSASRIDHARFVALAIEGELAIRLSRDLPRDPLSDEEYDEAVGSVFPVIELHHYVLPADGQSVAALITSGGMHAGLVVPAREMTCSGRVPLVMGLDVAIDDRLAGRTGEPWTMGGPAATLRWLAARLAGWGLPLRRGQVILTGSPLPLFPVGPGSRVVAEAGPLGMSRVEVDGPGPGGPVSRGVRS
jgi:2-keto-4-pentenoate hydratase